jgi:antitoxin (DNA-binding transcriptional repressor) of toxin-antitoxin stability system
MTKVNVTVDNNSFQDVISQVAESGERAIIEQEGQAIAAIISYTDLKRLEELEAVLLKKAELEEYEWLKAVVRNPGFDLLKAPEEDIYTLADGEPFHDPEWNKTVASDTTSGFITDPEEDIYTLADGEPFHDQG